LSKAYIVVLVTTKDTNEAHTISQALLEKKMVACVNTVSTIKSQYWWEGKVHEDNESLLIMKSTRDMFPMIVKEVKTLHSYSVPEIIALPIVEGNVAYLQWIEDTISRKD